MKAKPKPKREPLTDIQRDLLDHLSRLCRPTPRQTVVEWAEENLRLTSRQTEHPGPFSTSVRPYMREPMECWKDPTVSEATLCWGSQTAKTTTLMAGLAWLIDNEPSPALWLMPTENLARSFSKSRWMPLLEDSPAMIANFPADRHKLTNLEQHFTRATLTFVGTNSPANLASRPVRVLVGDEVDKFAAATDEEADALELAEQRLKAFSSSKAFLTSTPTVKSGRIWQRFLRGDQRRFRIPCPHCRELIRLDWKQVKWDPDARDDAGRWDFSKVRASSYYECQSCKGHISDAQKVAGLRHGKWVPENANALPGVRSYHLSSLYSPDRKCTWGHLAAAFLEAKEVPAGLQGFINGYLAEPWEEEMGVVDNWDFLDGRRAEYDFGEPWSEEERRFMAADRQESGGEHYWYVVRAFGPFGQSRLVAYGRCNTTLELEEIRKKWGVSLVNCMVDSGNKAAEVYRFCVATGGAKGWKPFKGDDAEWFLCRRKEDGKAVRRVWIKSMVDPLAGKRGPGRASLPLFRFSNPGVKDILLEQMQGLSGGWTIPRSVGREYLQQVTAERREESTDGRGRISFKWRRVRRDNHLWDCEVMIAAAAVITGNIGVPEKRPSGGTNPE